MAFNPAPTSIWSGYTSDGTNITIPIAALDGLTAAEAHTSTGDWREIMLSIVSTAYLHYIGLATADRPVAFVPSPPQVNPQNTGDLAETFRTVYSQTFYCDYTTPDVADEPA